MISLSFRSRTGSYQKTRNETVGNESETLAARRLITYLCSRSVGSLNPPSLPDNGASTLFRDSVTAKVRTG